MGERQPSIFSLGESQATPLPAGKVLAGEIGKALRSLDLPVRRIEIDAISDKHGVYRVHLGDVDDVVTGDLTLS
jgi:hypothetical protein